MIRRVVYGFGRVQRDGCGLKEVWPFLFKHKSNSWLYLLRSEGGLPIFYDYMMDSYRNGP